MGDQPESGGAKRLVSGIRPSGALHLGQYVGVLRQWLRYQHDHECYFIIADIQALTTHRDRPAVIVESVREVALDWLASGIDGEKNCFVVQSQIPELTELTVYLQLLVQTGELRVNPTMREEARVLGEGNLAGKLNQVNFGFLGYPIAQVADILAFSTFPRGANDRLIVPVGEDQIPHIEFARAIARRFNDAYGNVFLEPEAKTARVARLPGTDGGFKMGKSRRNTILLKEREEEYAEKLRGMFTDPLRLSHVDPGHPDGCPCFLYHRAFSGDAAETTRRHEDCELGVTDCSKCAEELVATVRAVLEPIQERRAAFERQPELVRDVLTRGTRRAAEVVRTTLQAVREAMDLTYPGLIGKVRAP